MIFAAIGDTGYNVVLLLHILTAFAAFAPVFAHPLIANQATKGDDAERSRIIGYLTANGRRIYAPALIVTGLLGFALQGMSEEVWGFDQTWFILAIVVWIAMNGLLHGVILPTERAMAEGDFSTESRLNIAGPAITILLVVMLWLMIFKPFL
ncbi:MAG: CopD family protein [Ilumatobacteraceae bacterium]